MINEPSVVSAVSTQEKAAISVAESFLHKDFVHVPVNLNIDPSDPLQEAPDINLWQEVQISSYEIIAPFVSSGQMTLEVCINFKCPYYVSKMVYMLIDMYQNNSLCFYRGIQDQLRLGLAAAV